MITRCSSRAAGQQRQPLRQPPPQRALQQVFAATLALVALVCVQQARALQCLDASGRATDWWVMMKLPVIAASSNPDAQQGYAFAYVDGSMSSLQVQKFGLDKGYDAMALTLKQVYKNGSHYQWLMYNDEEPSGKTVSTHAHAKGVLAYDDSEGFWLIHSVPRFPYDPSSQAYSFPADERIYGQSITCVTLSHASLSLVGKALQYNNPNIYASHPLSSLSGVVSTIDDLLNGVHQSGSGSFTDSISTVGGQPLTLFGKTSKWGHELYEDLVAPTLKSDLLCETWIRSPELPSYCKPTYKYNVVNVKQLSAGGDLSYAETEDHSKWAITQSGTNACIGDINRMSSQAGRGGGTLCYDNSMLHQTMKDMITSSDDCSGRLLTSIKVVV